MGDFTEGNMVFELGYVIPEWEVLCDRGGGEPGDCLVLDIDMDEQCFEVGIEGCPGSECKGFLGEGGCPDCSRPFLHEG